MPLVLTTEEMRKADRFCIDDIGLPGMVLMENAGRALAREVAKIAAPSERVVVLCGRGNNGGDGFVCARWLRAWGYAPDVLLANGRPASDGDAAAHLAALENSYGAVAKCDLGVHGSHIADADMIVDALLGTGLARDIGGDLSALIDRINDSAATTVSADVPSGLCGDTGHVLGNAVRADLTVTFAFAKLGLVTHPGIEHVGRLLVVDIGIPRRAAGSAQHVLLDDAEIAGRLPARPVGAHKGQLGHLLVVAGSSGKTGAAVLCAQGALRSGVGLLTLVSTPAARAALEPLVKEAMYADLSVDSSQAQALAVVDTLLAGKAAVAWGPGMPSEPPAGELLRAALMHLGVPTVLDADALNHLAGHLELLRACNCPLVLTPHPGEAARLLACTSRDVQSDRVSAARDLCEKTQAVVVLKGARSVIASPEGLVAINPTGNAGMATAGAGDVLAGVVGALLAQGLSPFDAACVGAYVHGRAGDRAAEQLGEISLAAGDLVDALSAAFVSVTRRPMT